MSACMTDAHMYTPTHTQLEKDNFLNKYCIVGVMVVLSIGVTESTGILFLVALSRVGDCLP